MLWAYFSCHFNGRQLFSYTLCPLSPTRETVYSKKREIASQTVKSQLIDQTLIGNDGKTFEVLFPAKYILSPKYLCSLCNQ